MRGRLDRALGRLVLSLYPASVRRERAAEIEQIYRHCVEVESRRRGPIVARVVALADAVRGGVVLRTRQVPIRRESLMRSLTQDLRFAARGFRRSPLFFGGILLVLALGIGANGAIFSLVKAVLLDPLPYRDPDRLVVLWTSDPRSPESRSYRASAEMLSSVRQLTADVLEVAGVMLWSSNKTDMDLVLDDRAERLRGAFVTPNFFQVLSVEAAHGRVSSEVDADGATMPAVVSHRFWTRLFAQDPSLIGRRLTLFGRLSTPEERQAHTMTVVGILPPAVRFTYPDEIEFWVLQSWPEVGRLPRGTSPFHVLLGRVAPGVALTQADARLAARRDAIFADRPPERRRSIGLVPMSSWTAGDTRPAVLLVTAVAGLLLLIACSTVAGALLVRLAERQRELAIRTSLGAGRSRLFRQLLTEGFVLAAAGGAAGSVLAVIMLPSFRALVPSIIPRGDELAAGGWMIVFAAGSATLVTVVATLVPAVLASRTDVVSAVKRVAPSASASGSVVRWRSALLATQTAVAACLAVGSVLLVASFWRLHQVDLGFSADGVVTLEMRLLDGRSEHERARFQDELIGRVRAIPGVTQAGITTSVPFRGVDFTHAYDAPGCERPPSERPTPECAERRVAAGQRSVDPEYFDVMGIEPLRGRLLLPTDRAGGPKVAVVSESFANNMFPGEDPLGRTFDGADPLRIVGVIPDLRYVRRDVDPRPAVYVARAQEPSELICLVVQTAPGVPGVGDALREAVHATDPTVPAMNLTTIDQIISDSVADRRFYTATTSAFAGLALLLTATGLIVVVGRAVTERRREMAIRSALGARTGQLVGMVTRQGLVPVLIGAAAGLALAWAGTRLLEQFLFEISPREPIVYAATGALTAAVAGLACLVPARRLGRLQPAEVLRGE